MRLDNINKDNYNEFIDYLFSLQDIKYKEFTNKIIDANIIGIRMPIIRQISKKISNNYKDFIKNNKHIYYEETMIHGLIIGYLKDFNEVTYLLNDYISYVDNWGVCDSVCSNLKIFRKNQEEGFKLIEKYLKINKPFYIRFALVLLLNHYINDLYIDKILNICNDVKIENYYVKMANAWLLSMCYIKYPDKTYNFLLNNHLDKFTFNKTISKICDSHCVDIDTKNKLKRLRK